MKIFQKNNWDQSISSQDSLKMLNNLALSFIWFWWANCYSCAELEFFIKNGINFKNSSMTTWSPNSNNTTQVNNRQPAATQLLYVVVVGEGWRWLCSQL